MDFIELPAGHGDVIDLSGTPHPSMIWVWRGGTLRLPHGMTHFGLVSEGEASLGDPHGTFRIGAAMFFVTPDACEIEGSNGAGIVISRIGYRGLWQMGGPLEPTGRLRYIDGCSDTVLVSPPRLGDPCLNHLHIPAGTSQTQHAHPSDRIGIIVRGAGECRTPGGIYRLRGGMAWRIPAGAIHSFYTKEDCLDVIAWHPDSDVGPTDERHPMLTRTIVNGVSAAEIDSIRTR